MSQIARSCFTLASRVNLFSSAPVHASRFVQRHVIPANMNAVRSRLVPAARDMSSMASSTPGKSASLSPAATSAPSSSLSSQASSSSSAPAGAAAASAGSTTPMASVAQLPRFPETKLLERQRELEMEPAPSAAEILEKLPESYFAPKNSTEQIMMEPAYKKPELLSQWDPSAEPKPGEKLLNFDPAAPAADAARKVLAALRKLQNPPAVPPKPISTTQAFEMWVNRFAFGLTQALLLIICTALSIALSRLEMDKYILVRDLEDQITILKNALIVYKDAPAGTVVTQDYFQKEMEKLMSAKPLDGNIKVY